MIPHEKRPGDAAFTRYFLSSCDGFITLSEHVLNDLRKFVPDKPAKYSPHPLYDNFGEPVPAAEARHELGLPPTIFLFEFFGFIRKYKGLDLLLRAVNIVKKTRTDFRLLIAGEFYENEETYSSLISELEIGDLLLLHTDFVPDSKVQYYLSAADVIVQPYRHATQSGVTPLAYHFKKPMLVTSVGGLPAVVPNGSAGLVVEPTPEAIAAGMLDMLDRGVLRFTKGIEEIRSQLSWKHLVNEIVLLSSQILAAKH